MYNFVVLAISGDKNYAGRIREDVNLFPCQVDSNLNKRKGHPEARRPL